MVHYRGGRDAIDKRVYPNLEQFWDDLALAYAQELQQLYDLGCRYLQLDDTSMAYVNDPGQREHVASIGGDPMHQHETYIATMNKALSRPPGRHGHHRAHLPWQQPVHVGGRGQLRLRRRHAVQPAQRRRVLLRVGRRALRRVRAAALPAQGQARRARRCDQQARRTRVQGLRQAPHRGSREVHRHRAAVPVRAVRVLLHEGGQRPHSAAAVGQAPPDRRGRLRGLGRTKPEPFIPNASRACRPRWPGPGRFTCGLSRFPSRPRRLRGRCTGWRASHARGSPGACPSPTPPARARP